MLRIERQAKGLSAQELSLRLQMHPTYYKLWVRKRKDSLIDLLTKLVKSECLSGLEDDRRELQSLLQNLWIFRLSWFLTLIL
jgi:transcriptional regulator with XRE-family HTH domain